MKTLAALTLAVLFASAAAPALASSCSGTSGSDDLTGTTWVGTARWNDGETNTIKLKLRADCVAEYSYNGNTYTNGHWVQRGELLEWDTNDHYAVYLANIKGRTASGVIYNSVGNQGTWTFTRSSSSH